MSDKEYMECSVVAYPRHIKFLHINGGVDSYYVDRHVSDYVDRLQQENQELKKQLANNGIVKTCENCEWFGTCPHSYKEYDYKNECEKLKKQLEELGWNK